MSEVLDSDLECVLVTEDQLGEGVSDEDYVDIGCIYDAGEGRIVGRDHHYGIGSVAALARADLRHRHLTCHLQTSSRPAHVAAGGRSAVVSSCGEDAQEMVPRAASADFYHVARDVDVAPGCLGEFAEIDTGKPLGRQSRAESEGDVDELLVLTDGALGFRLASQVLRDT